MLRGVDTGFIACGTQRRDRRSPRIGQKRRQQQDAANSPGNKAVGLFFGPEALLRDLTLIQRPACSESRHGRRYHDDRAREDGLGLDAEQTAGSRRPRRGTDHYGCGCVSSLERSGYALCERTKNGALAEPAQDVDVVRPVMDLLWLLLALPILAVEIAIISIAYARLSK